MEVSKDVFGGRAIGASETLSDTIRDRNASPLGRQMSFKIWVDQASIFASALPWSPGQKQLKKFVICVI